MKIFTTALLACATLSLPAQEVFFNDDFSWLDVPAVTSQKVLHDTTGEGDNVFDNQIVADRGIQNTGWTPAVADLNAEHTLRLSPSGGDPANLFEHSYTSVYMRPGYLKMGRTNWAGAILTPEFKGLGSRTADVEVTFRMCGYTSKGSAAKPGNKDATNVYVTVFDNCDGEMEDADYEQTASDWIYPCKSFKVTNYYPSVYNEYGENYDPWADDVSLYTVKVIGATANTRLWVFAGGYGSEINGRSEPATIELPINKDGATMEFAYKPNINRIGLKGCTMKIVKVTSGVDEIEADTNAPAEYFNLQGIRVANPEKGQIYIKRQGAKATKVAF